MGVSGSEARMYLSSRCQQGLAGGLNLLPRGLSPPQATRVSSQNRAADFPQRKRSKTKKGGGHNVSDDLVTHHRSVPLLFHSLEESLRPTHT